MSREAAEALVTFGFTSLESEIYAQLLKDAPATGYRVALTTGKPVANVYKALQSLEAKGAVLVEEGDARLVRPIPPDVLFARLGKEFETRRKRAEQLLKKSHRKVLDERIYTVKSAAQAIGKLQGMIEQATTSVEIRASDAVATQLADVLAVAAGRGLDVRVVTNAVADFGTAYTTHCVNEAVGSPDEVFAVVDTEEAVLAEIDGEAAEGVITRQPLLVRFARMAVLSDHALGEIQLKIEEGAGAKRISRVIRELRRSDPDAV